MDQPELLEETKERKQANPSKIRIAEIHIQNYKGIKNLKLKFKDRPIPSDLDVSIIGSANGIGKTAVLECCALLMLAPFYNEQSAFFEDKYGPPRRFERIAPFLSTLFHFDSDNIKINGVIDFGKDSEKFGISISKSNTFLKFKFEHEEDSKLRKFFGLDKRKGMGIEKLRTESSFSEKLESIFGLSFNSMSQPICLNFNSYRKITETNPDFGTLVRGRDSTERMLNPISRFKADLLRMQMAEANLFDHVSFKFDDRWLPMLKSLLREFAGMDLAKPSPTDNSEILIRVKPLKVEDSDQSISFDGLSSGQKEIIATLYQIYTDTIDRPKVVLIDEPELHLNAEWHRVFLNWLKKNAPQNQYIIATHSDFIWEYAQKKQRIYLENKSSEKGW
ncbi:MAG: ATP-binding protein [Candidatus Pacebacteria bacterium]|nr:ATP-binding protein [Candidatus Paceibacterota bacterium]